MLEVHGPVVSEPVMELAWGPPGGPTPHSCCSEGPCVMSTTVC